MSLQSKLNESIRKAQLKKVEQEPFNIQHSWVVIPFYVSGVQNYTNRGYTPYEINPNDAETFKRIWTGNDSCCIVWENSVKIINNNNNEPSLSYQLGSYKLGLMVSNSSNNEVLKDSGYSEYTSEQIKNYLTFQFDAKTTEFTAYDMLKFYKVPRFSKEDIYRIVNIHKTFNQATREIDYYTVSFESVNQTFSNTGRAKQQNINMSSVGQGYLNPVVYSEKEFKNLPNYQNLVLNTDYIILENGEYLTADQTKFQHRPAKKAIVKMYGNAMPISISFVGRPVFYNDPLEKLRSLRLIFPVTLEQPITPNLQRTSNSTNNWYFGDFAPNVAAWKDFMSSIKNYVNNVVTQQKFSGTFLFNKEKVLNSNPLLADGNYSFSLFSTKTNNVISNWQPNIPQELDTIKYTFGVIEKDLKFHKFGNQKNILDLMFDNYWINKNLTQIPLNLNETSTFGSFINAGLSTLGSAMRPSKNWLNVFGLIGASAALLGIGIGFTFARENVEMKFKTISSIVSAPFLDLSTLQFENLVNGKNYIPITSFNNTTPDVVNSLIFNSSNSFNFQVQMELTDLFENQNSSGGELHLNPDGIWSTTSIGQETTFEDSNGVLHTITGKPRMLMNGLQKLVPHRNIAGYIIEQINIDSCFAGDISIEFLDVNDEVIYSGIYQSQAKWTGNIRDRWTTINTSIFNNQNIFVSKPFKYPRDIINPTNTNWIPKTMLSQEIFIYIEYELFLLTNDPHRTPPKKRTNITQNIINSFSKTPIVLFSDYKWINWNIILNNYSHLEIKYSFDYFNSIIRINFSSFVLKNNEYVYNLVNNTTFSINNSINGQYQIYIWNSSNSYSISSASKERQIDLLFQIKKMDLNIVFSPLKTNFELKTNSININNIFENENSQFAYGQQNIYYKQNNSFKQQLVSGGIEYIKIVPKN